MMKIVCDTAVLCEAVANVSRAVSAKSALPVLSGILFRTDGLKAVTLSGYDLEMGITTTIPAEVEEEGELVLSAKLLFEMLRKLPAERVTLACDDKLLTVIRGGTAEFAILAMDADEFPDMPAPRQEDSIHLPQPVLKSMINQTIFAVASGDTKPVHTGSKFEAEGDLLTIVSVDGFRLAMRKEHAQLSGPMSFVVPGKTLSEIAKLLGDEEEESCDIAVGRRHVVFSIGGYSVVSRLLDGEFLNYRSAIPESGTTTVTVGVRALIETVDRASLLITDRLRSPLRCRFADNLIHISCSTAIGKAYDECPCEMSGEAVEIGFNNRYLLDALKSCDTDEVHMTLGGPLSPMKILPPEGDDFLFLVLPVRL